MNTRLLFNASAVIELLTGIVMLVAPGLIIGLLLGDGVSPIGIAVARILGIGLLSVGVAGWESSKKDIRIAPRTGLCVYNVGTGIVLTALATYGGINGIILWPVAGLHALIGAAMLWVIMTTLGDKR